MTEEESKDNEVKIGYKTYKFPVWKGTSSITKEDIEVTKKLWLDDKDAMARGLLEAHMEKQYLMDMLLYIQAKLDNHICEGEPLGLCLNSANEIFDGLIISPCKKEYIDKNISYVRRDFDE